MAEPLPFPEPAGLTLVERTRWALMNHPEMLNEVAFQEFKRCSDDPYDGQRQRATWDGMSDQDKQVWRDRAMAGMEEFWAMSPAEQRLANRNALLKILAANAAAAKRDRP